MRILVTGFEPFGGQSVNPSWEAVRPLGGGDVVTACLPVSWNGAPQSLLAAIAESKPDCVLLCGQAGGRSGVSVELCAVNECRTDLADNALLLHPDAPILAGGPARYEATYPRAAILSALARGGIEAHPSEDAGRFICNLVLYTALHHAATRCPSLTAGFLHLPYLPEQSETAPTMAAPLQLRALRLALEAIRNA